MTTHKHREIARVRQEVQRTVQLAHAALAALDPAAAIAQCRRLRSILWHAERDGFDRTTLAPTAPTEPALDERT